MASDIGATLQRLKDRVLVSDSAGTAAELLRLKKQSRILHEEAAVSKENVMTLRKAVDTSHLAIQSVQYEKKQLEKDLQQSLATPMFDSVEFSEPRDVDVDLDQRGRMQWRLDRINQEVQAREEMAKELELAQGELNKIFNEVSVLKDLLSGLPGKVDEVEKATQQLEKFIGMPSLSERRARNEVAAKAPGPLLCLFRAIEKAEDVAHLQGFFALRVKEDPCVVIVELYGADGLSETIEFSYVAAWNVILAEPQIVQDILFNLLEDGDMGETMPISSQNQQQEPQSFKAAFKRPFKWAQVIAGLPVAHEGLSPAASSLNGTVLVERILDKLNIKYR